MRNRQYESGGPAQQRQAAAADIWLAGNILADIVKNVDCYPERGMLANISGIRQSVGGCVPNTAMDLAAIDPSLRLGVIGRVGCDSYGDYVLGQMAQRGIDISRVSRSTAAPTSFSDVISEPGGERTFFHARGANAEFAPEDAGLDTLQGRLLHAGYIMLLDRFDAADPQYGTGMARFLNQAQQRGIETSIDAVSNSTGQYRRTMLPALRYSHYAIVNEIESCAIWGLAPRKADGSLAEETVREAMERMAEAGTTPDAEGCGGRMKKVIVHSKEAGFCLDTATGRITRISSLRLQKEQIAGSVGAGDAFCAGCLYGLYNGYEDEKLLSFASAAAACSLMAENSVDGMRNQEEIWALARSCARW